MDRSNIIILVSSTKQQTSAGVWIDVDEVKKTVFADVRQFNRSDWYEAGRNGLNPALVFYVFSYDYNGEEVIEYNNERYYVYRTHEGRNPDVTELYTQKRSGKVADSNE